MQVHAIQSENYFRSLKLKECDPKTGDCGIQEKTEPELSIYSKGGSKIAFTSMFRPKHVITSFEKEIAEQPMVLRNLYEKFFSKAGKINLDLKLTPEAAKDLKRLYIIASGSSKNAARMAQGYLEQVTGIPVYINEASEFLLKGNEYLKPKEDLAIFVSQSGNTADTYMSFKNAKENGIATISVTNYSDSKLAKETDDHINIQADTEHAVAATKTVTSSIFSLYALGLKLRELKGGSVMRRIDELKSLIVAVNNVVNRPEDVKEAANIIAKADNVYIYSKGSGVGAAEEGALKLTETTGKRVIPGASGEALHGMFASIQSEDPVINVITEYSHSAPYSMSVNNMDEIVSKRRVKHPIVIGEVAPSDKKKSYTYIDMPNDVNKYLKPLLATIKLQQITNEVTKILKINPDNGGGFLTKYRQNMSM